MKRRRFSIAAALLCLVAAITLGGAGIASAHSFHKGDNVSLSSGKRIDDTVFAAGRSVDIGSEVFGDVFAAGQTVSISGVVHGDVIAAGQTVNISGKVEGDVRLAAQTVNLSATVSGNATVAGQSFVLDSKGSVGGDVTTGATDVTLNGAVGRDAALGGDRIVIAGSIGRNVTSGANHLHLLSGAHVAGNVSYTSAEKIQQDKGAVVSGNVARTEPAKDHKAAKSGGAATAIAWFLYSLAAALLFALALTLLLPGLFEAVTNLAFPRPWIALLVGFVASIIAPMLGIILGISLVGLPLAFLLGLTWLIILILSGPVFAYYIGRLIFKGPRRNALLTMLVGAAVLLVLYFIPIIQVFAVLAALWIGSGLILTWLYRRAPKPAYTYTTAGQSTRPKPSGRA